MSSVFSYKTNDYFLSPWAFYGRTPLVDSFSGNPANNGLKKNTAPETIDVEIGYKQGEKNFKHVEPEKATSYAAGLWYKSHFIGMNYTNLTQDQLKYNSAGTITEKFPETENKYTISYAYPFINNYLAGGVSLNINETTKGFNSEYFYSRAGLDLGLTGSYNGFSLGFGARNLSYAQTYNNIDYKPDSSWGLGASYRFDSNIYLAADYNKYLYSDLFNTSLRGKYEFTSKYLNITPEVIYMLNNNIAGETNQKISSALGIGHDFKIERTVKKPYEVPVLAGFTYTYQISSDSAIPIQFRKVTISKEFSKQEQNWNLSVYAPPLNKTGLNSSELFCIFELKNEAGKKYFFTQEIDKGSPKDSVALTVKVPAGKYYVTSYYADQNRNIVSPIYADPDPKYIGICYNISESIVDSDLAVTRQHANALYDLQDEYLSIYHDYSECFDYIQTDIERQKKSDAYGAINVIYRYLEENTRVENIIATKEKEVATLRGNMITYTEQLSSSEISSDKYAALMLQYKYSETKILDLENENTKSREVLDNNKKEIAAALNRVNTLNAVPELIGLPPEEQINKMIEYRPLYLERYNELKDQQMKGLKLDKVSALNNDFHQFYGKTYNVFSKMLRSDLSQQTKNLEINQAGIDNLLDGMLKKNNLTPQEKFAINNLQFGQSVVFYYPFHNVNKSIWTDQKGYLEVSYAKVEGLKKEEYAEFIKRQAKLRGTSRLKPNTEIGYEIKKYETRWKDVDMPYYIGFDLNVGYGYNFGTNQTSEYTGQAALTLKGF